jgi:hypothetical protein
MTTPFGQYYGFKRIEKREPTWTSRNISNKKWMEGVHNCVKIGPVGPGWAVSWESRAAFKITKI